MGVRVMKSADALLAVAISSDGVQHLSVLAPGADGRKQAVDFFRKIAPAIDRLDAEVKALSRGNGKGATT